MKLTDLDAHFVKLVPPDPAATDERQYESKRFVDSLAEADGVMFQCPKCFARNCSAVSTHYVLCWFKGKVPSNISPGPGRWNPSGTGLNDLTFVPPGAVSVWLQSGCGWHGFVRNGDAS